MTSMSAGVRTAKGQFVNARQQKLATAQYLPPSLPIARVFFHHGVGEHIGRYENVFPLVAQQGVAVFSYDAHGHGLSEPKEDWSRALVYRFDDLVDDMCQYIDEMNKAYPDTATLPSFLMGHSLGGLVAIYTALQNQDKWAGLILHSPAIDVEWTLALRLQAPIGSWLGWLWPTLRSVPAVSPEDMSQDPKVVAAYKADPLIFHGPLPVRTGAEVLAAFQKLSHRYSEITLPLYAAHGSLDRCTSMPATKHLVALANSKDKVFHEVQGGYHELLMGPDMQPCIQQLNEWILAHVTPSHASSKL